MGFWDLFKSDAVRNHEEKMQQKTHEHREKIREIDSKLEKERITSAERAAYAERISREREAAMSNATERYAIKTENDTKITLAAIQKEINQQAESEKTERRKIAEMEDSRRVAYVEATKQADIQAKQDIRIREMESQEKKYQIALQMFSTYMQSVVETYNGNREALIKLNNDRKEKFLALLESTRAEKARVLELSKEAKGQEKLDYLDKADDLENTIRMMIDNDAKQESEYIATLAILTHKRDKEIEENCAQMLDVKTVFLNANKEDI